MTNFQRSSLFLSIAASVTLVLGFQNCTNTRFTSNLDGAVLKAEALPVDSVVRDEGDDGQTVAPGDVPPNPEPPIDDPSSTPPPDDKKADSGHPDAPSAGGSPQGDGPSDSDQATGLVECQMLHPNKKIVLSYEFEVKHTNSSSVRACMSRNACLSLINAYAVANSCSLVPGEPNSAGSNQAQCTEIFPGSKGTCHNATVLSDEDVLSLLKKMSEQK